MFYTILRTHYSALGRAHCDDITTLVCDDVDCAFVCRVAEHCKLNSMDSKNLAICWWPTLFHTLQFSDIVEFESHRPHIEDVVQTMIDQFPFLFQGKEDYVMV